MVSGVARGVAVELLLIRLGGRSFGSLSSRCRFGNIVTFAWW